MDTEFSSFVNDSAGIAASGRWAAVNARIEAVAANPGPENAWWVQIFASLCSQNFGEYLSLKRAYENKQNDDVALLAWRARNLLELSVWSTYSAKNRDNARRVYEDAGRDVRGVYDVFIKWGTGLHRRPIGSTRSRPPSRISLSARGCWTASRRWMDPTNKSAMPPRNAGSASISH